MRPKYDVEVELVGHDGNAFAIMGRVQRELRRFMRTELEMTHEEAKAELDKYVAEATSGDYDNLLQTTMRWVHVV